MNTRLPRIVALAAGIVSIPLAVYLEEYSWTVFIAIALALLFLPSIKHMDVDYHDRIFIMAVIPPILAIILCVIEICTGSLRDHSTDVFSISAFSWIFAVVKSITAMTCGLMYAALKHHNGTLKTSRTWAVVIAMFFALTVVGLCMFTDVITMYIQGYTIHNSGTDYPPELAYVNGRVMSVPAVAVIVVSILAGLFGKKRDTIDMGMKE